MTRTNRKWLLLSFLASFSAMAEPAQSGFEAGHCHGIHMHGGGWMMEKPLPADIAKKLKLSAEQVQNIAQLAQKAREAAEPS